MRKEDLIDVCLDSALSGHPIVRFYNNGEFVIGKITKSSYGRFDYVFETDCETADVLDIDSIMVSCRMYSEKSDFKGWHMLSSRASLIKKVGQGRWEAIGENCCRIATLWGYLFIDGFSHRVELEQKL